MEDPVVPLERNLYGHPVAGLSWERQFEEVLFEHGWGKVPNWECLFVHREKGFFLSVYVDDIKLAGKTENIEPTWKNLMKDHVYLGCTQRECQISNEIVANYKDLFESRISARPKDEETMSSWSLDMEGHAKKCEENLQIKRLSNFSKSQRHAWMTINLEKKKMSQ